MAIKSFRRYEKKFILSAHQYNKLIPKLLKFMDEDEHCKNESMYSVHNVYYDTRNNDVIRHSISKPYYKEKLRLRSYNSRLSLDSKVFLELKKKIDGIVTKRRVIITLGEAYKFLYEGIRPQCSDYLNNQILDELEYYLSKNEVYPNVYISYKRKAFFAKNDRDFRVTFDKSIIARRNEVSLEKGEYGNPIFDEDKYLMEVKILGAMPVWFTKFLSELKIYNTHYSKYGNEFMEYINKDKRSAIVC
ncbi:MAG: polyphosphate polymerase domain-containing protein [Clostridium sp.]